MVLVGGGDEIDLLVHGFGGDLFGVDFDHDGIQRPAVGEFDDFRREGGAVQQGLAAILVRRARDDAAHLGNETHVEHAVGLVEDEQFDHAEMEIVVADEIDQPAGRGDDDVHGFGVERPMLLAVILSADEGYHVQVAVTRQLFGVCGDLAGEFAGRRDDQRARFGKVTLAVGGIAEQVVDDGNKEGGGLAGAGLGLAGYVVALQGVLEAFGLDWRAMGEAEGAYGFAQGLLQVEGVKCDQAVVDCLHGALLYSGARAIALVSLNRAGFAARIPGKFEVAPLHGGRVEKQEAAYQGSADAGYRLDRFHGLDGADDSDQGRHDAVAGATRIEFADPGIEALIARAFRIVRVESGDLALHADGGGGNQRLAVGETGLVDGEARFEVVAGIEHEVCAGHGFVEPGSLQALVYRSHFHIRIQVQQSFAGGFDLGLAEGLFGVGDLALQIGQFDDIVIGNNETPHAGGGKIHGGGTAEPAHADYQHAGVHEFPLPGDIHLRQHDLAAEAQ